MNPEEQKNQEVLRPGDPAALQSQKTELTFGQKAVGLTFNPSGDPDVIKAKQICADAIDQMHDLREASTSGEYKALATIAIRKLQSAQMDMVKAITWKD